MKKWMKCPYPGEPKGEGVWHECNTPYLRWLFTVTDLPTYEGNEPPPDTHN